MNILTAVKSFLVLNCGVYILDLACSTVQFIVRIEKFNEYFNCGNLDFAGLQYVQDDSKVL